MTMSTMEKKHDSEPEETLALEGLQHRPSHVRRLLLWSLLPLAIILGIYAWSRNENSTTLEYRTVEAKQGDLTVTVSATGNLEPTNQVDVGSEVSGTIASVSADYNDFVKAGQVLARLDTTLLEAQVNQSRSALEAARANLVLAQANVQEAKSTLDRFANVRDLSKNKIPSIQEFDTASAALKRAQATESMIRANIAQAEAKLRTDQTNLEKATIVSPINGVVLARSVEKGQTVAASLQAPVLFTLAEDLTKMELHVNVDEADVGQVKEGQQATFTVDAYPDRTFPARITQVRYGSQISAGVVTYLTVLNVDNSDLSLRPGMTATADIIVRQDKNVLLVPNAALRFSPPQQEAKSRTTAGGSLLSKLFPRPARNRQQKNEEKADRKNQRVWTLRARQPVAVPVTTGATDGNMTEITGGNISPGTKLIIEAVSREK